MTNSTTPIFIVGTGRCGSTVFHQMLAEHPHLAFLSSSLIRKPANYGLQRQVLNAWGNPLTGPFMRKILGPAEAWPFWDHHLPGFPAPFRDFRAEDLLTSNKEKIRKVLAQVVTKKRPQLLVKFTGWTRVGFIKEVYPDAKIIHIIRDPHPVVHSMLKVTWWSGWKGPEQWRWGPLSEADNALWEQYNQSFPVLAAIEWKKIMAAYWESLACLDGKMRDDVIDIHYRTLCEQPRETLEKVFDFCQLGEREASINQILSRFNLVNMDHKWRKSFSEFQQQELEAALEQMNWENLLEAPKAG